MSIIPYGAAIFGGGTLNPSTAALIAAMTTKPDSVHSNAINTFIVGLKNAGLWDTIDFMCGWGALNAAQSFRINWKNPAQIGTAQNSPVFAVDGGYTFDGTTNYVDTGFAPATNGVNVTSTSVTIGVYERSNLASNTLAAGVQATSVRRLSIMPRSAASFMRAALNSSLVSGAVTISDSRGLSMASLTGGVASLYKNGAFIDNITVTPAALSASAVFIGGEDVAGSLSGGRAATEAGLVLAGGWSAAQTATFYSLAQACMTTIGANV